MPTNIAIISLELGAAILFWLLFVVLDAAIFQFLNWGDFRQCLRASLFANLASGFFVILSMVLIPQLGLPGLVAGCLVSILIQGRILIRLKPETKRLNWLAAILANVVCLVILVLPIYWFIRQ